MDSPNTHASTLSCISAVKNRKRKAPDRNVYASMKIPTRRLYFFPPTRRQRWSLPGSIIYYMAKNPKSPKVYQNLTRSCKYFFDINPVIICSDLTYVVAQGNDGDDEGRDIWKIEQGGEQKIVELNKVSTKLWISDEIVIGFFNRGEDDVAANIKQNLASSVIPNIYCCAATALKFREQTISFTEYKFLVSNVKMIDFERVTVLDEDGSVTALEKLFEVLVNVEQFILFCSDNDTSVSSETAQNLLKIPHFTTMKSFGLYNLSDPFDVDTWFTYAKKNKKTSFFVCFCDFISDAFKNHIEEIIDEIIDAPNRDYFPPLITFEELDEEKYGKLRGIYDSYNL